MDGKGKSIESMLSAQLDDDDDDDDEDDISHFLLLKLSKLTPLSSSILFSSLHFFFPFKLLSLPPQKKKNHFYSFILFYL